MLITSNSDKFQACSSSSNHHSQHHCPLSPLQNLPALSLTQFLLSTRFYHRLPFPFRWRRFKTKPTTKSRSSIRRCVLLGVFCLPSNHSLPVVVRKLVCDMYGLTGCYSSQGILPSTTSRSRPQSLKSTLFSDFLAFTSSSFSLILPVLFSSTSPVFLFPDITPSMPFSVPARSMIRRYVSQNNTRSLYCRPC